MGPVYLSGTAAAAVGLLALGVVTADAGWRFVRHGTMMAHEGAHAVMGSLLFRGVFEIYLDSDATGGTWVGEGGCLGSIAVSFAGYVGPSLFGLGVARLIQAGRGPAVLWVALVLLAVLAVLLMKSYGMITVVLAGALMYVVARYTPVTAQIITACAIAWLLLLSGVRRVLEVGVRSGDGVDLRQLTSIPRVVWFLLWLAATLGAVAVGGSMLVMPP